MSTFMAANSPRPDQALASATTHAHSESDTDMDSIRMNTGMTDDESQPEAHQSEIHLPQMHLQIDSTNDGTSCTTEGESVSKKRKSDIKLQPEGLNKKAKISMSLKIRHGVPISASVGQSWRLVSKNAASSIEDNLSSEVLDNSFLPPIRKMLHTSPPFDDGQQQIVQRLRAISHSLRANDRVMMPLSEKGKKKNDLWVLLQRACGELDKNILLAEEIEGINESFLQREQDLKQREQRIAAIEAQLRQQASVSEWLAEQQEGVLLEAAQQGVKLATSVQVELNFLRDQFGIETNKSSANDYNGTRADD